MNERGTHNSYQQLYSAIEALNLPQGVNFDYSSGDENYLYVESAYDGDCLNPLSKALNQLQIECKWISCKEGYRLSIATNQVQKDEFASQLKTYYQQELAKIEGSLFYIKNSKGFKSSMILLTGALFPAVFCLLGVATGILPLVILGIAGMLALLILSIGVGYGTISTGKGSGKENTHAFTEDNLNEIPSHQLNEQPALKPVLTKEEIEELNLLRKAQQGDAEAQFKMGELYFNFAENQTGEETLKCQQKGVQYFHKAAAQGHAMAQYKLMICYGMGTGVEKDLKKAKEYHTLVMNNTDKAGKAQVTAIMQQTQTEKDPKETDSSTSTTKPTIF